MSATQDRRREDNARRNGLSQKISGPFALDLPLKLLRNPAISPELSMRVGSLTRFFAGRRLHRLLRCLDSLGLGQHSRHAL